MRPLPSVSGVGTSHFNKIFGSRCNMPLLAVVNPKSGLLYYICTISTLAFLHSRIMDKVLWHPIRFVIVLSHFHFARLDYFVRYKILATHW